MLVLGNVNSYTNHDNAGYISWTRAKYGSYSQLSAMEFSEEMAKQMGWES